MTLDFEDTAERLQAKLAIGEEPIVKKPAAASWRHLNPASFVHLPFLTAQLRSGDRELVASLEAHYEGHSLHSCMSPAEARAYLSVTEHVYACDLHSESILLPHNLAMRCIDQVAADTKSFLIDSLWRVFVPHRERLVRRLVLFNAYYPPGSTELVLKATRGRCSYSFGDLHDVVVARNSLSHLDRITAAALNHAPVCATKWTTLWADERFFRVASAEAQVALAIPTIVAMSFLSPAEMVRFPQILQGIQMRLSSADASIRTCAMLVGECYSTVAACKEARLVFPDMPDSELARAGRYALYAADIERQADGRPTCGRDVARCEPEDDSDDEYFEPEDVQSRTAYERAGERLPQELRGPRSLMEAIHVISEAKDSAKAVVAIGALPRLLKSSSTLYLQEHAISILGGLFIPNTFNAPAYEASMQGAFSTMLEAAWADDQKYWRRRLCLHCCRMWFGDTGATRALSLNLTQRLSILTRIVNTVTRQTAKPDSFQEWEDFPMFRELLVAPAQTGERPPLLDAVGESFFVPFIRQAGMEFDRFFASNPIASHRVLLFTGIILEECRNQLCYADIVQSALPFMKRFLLAEHEPGITRATMLSLRVLLARWPIGPLSPLSQLPFLEAAHAFLKVQRADGLLWATTARALDRLGDMRAVLDANEAHGMIRISKT